MSKADKIFEKMGYFKKETKEVIEYIKIETKDTEFMTFMKDKKTIYFHIDYTEYPGINIEELQAITKKCKELGWLVNKELEEAIEFIKYYMKQYFYEDIAIEDDFKFEKAISIALNYIEKK